MCARDCRSPAFSRSRSVKTSLLAAACTAAFAVAWGHPPSTIPDKPQDLTGLSLEALLHEEITPINVLGSHTHPKGTFMIGYRYMYTDMSHNQAGTRDVSGAEGL